MHSLNTPQEPGANDVISYSEAVRLLRSDTRNAHSKVIHFSSNEPEPYTTVSSDYAGGLRVVRYDPYGSVLRILDLL